MKNSKKVCIYLVLIFAVVLSYSFDSYNSKMSSDLSKRISYQNSEEKNLVWVFFKDKGPAADNIISTPEIFLTKESINRRMKRIKSERIFDEKDIPVYYAYIEELKAEGIQVKQKSKWFNAVSCYANKIQIEKITEKDFVKTTGLVKKYSSGNRELFDINNNIPENNFNTDNPTEMNYGPSLNQVNLINVPPVHDEGYSGREILIASLDAGFDNLQHPCFDSMLARGVRTFDFVNGDTIVANGTGRMGDGAHGTLTLSQIAGYKQQSLIAPAFSSRYILAKTENTDSETPLEEDNWIAAAEWADSLGAEIITSSLGYLNFDPPYQSYTWQSMDGNTALITRAADIAVGKGIIVVISSGNDGYNSSHNTLNVPADGDSVITVGSVNLNRVRSAFSSIGPTSDGRIKPDVMALGNGNYCARSGAGNTGYTSGASGTSLACPMVAGVCALMLSANPNLSPIDVRNILRNTANNNASPDRLVGWGIIDAFAAVNEALETNITSIPSEYELFQNYPNPFNPSTTFRFNLVKSSNVSIVIYDVRGVEVDRAINNKFINEGSNRISYSNTNLSSGVYFYSLIVNGSLIDSKKMVLIY